jgi:formylglycine-generating enzyme required for sulfatase activity
MKLSIFNILLMFSLLFIVFFSSICFAWVPPPPPKAKVKKRTARPATKRPGKVGAKAKPGPKAVEVKINPKDGAEMVWVPAGEFIMGSTDEQTAVLQGLCPKSLQRSLKFSLDSEKPQRKVYLDGYWIYKYEVMVAQYRKFCEATGRKMPDAPAWGWNDNHPIVNVTWYDADAYSKWAGVTLPTEAQWEKAARGTDGRIYSWGNLWDPSKCANFMEEDPQPVGSYPSDASPYGAMDMSGNAEEWCADWYDPNYYKNAPTKNPTGPSEAMKFWVPISGKVSGTRVLRGRGRYSYDVYRCAYRDLGGPASRCRNIGFRCARTF